MASLVVVSGPAAGRHIALADKVSLSIGRDDHCDVQIVDKAVSRTHLKIRFEPTTKRHLACDYRSANGVFVNNERIEQDTPLYDGDFIDIGSSRVIYSMNDFDDAESAMRHVKSSKEWARSTIMRKSS